MSGSSPPTPDSSAVCLQPAELMMHFIFYIYIHVYTVLRSQVTLITLISCESFCIDCCIPPNCPYIRSLTFSRESLTCAHRRVSNSQRMWSTWRLALVVSTHLPDVPHFILKVTVGPLSCHHLLLSVRARPLHHAVHFGPMMLQRGLWHPIGHVSGVLRETGSHRSGFCSHPLTDWHLLCNWLLTYAHLQVHRLFTCGYGWHAIICTVYWIRIFHFCCWALEMGGWELMAKKSAACWRCHVSATWYMSCCCFCLLYQQPDGERCTAAQVQGCTSDRTNNK